MPLNIRISSLFCLLAGATLGLQAACMAYEPLRLQAASDMECSTNQVDIQENNGLYEATGCGRSALYSCTVDTQSRQHCVPQGRTEQETLRMVAPPVLKCPRTRLKIEDRGEGVYEVAGCGRHQTFLCRAGLGFHHCNAR
jgi:hypothetical protein